jgi:hypothetical protein
MKKITIKYGIFSGVLMSVCMLATLPFLDTIGYSNAEIVGYAGMVIAFLPVFLGVSDYRKNIGDGNLAFSKAVSIAMLCSVIACLF